MLKNPDDNIFNIDEFYKNYLSGPKIFKNARALDPSFIPSQLPHRDKEIQKIAELTACALFGDIPPNFLCYGRTGTGKTATVRFLSQKLALAKQQTTNKPWWIYINCSIFSTSYRILAHIYNSIIGGEKIPPTGLPKDVIFKRLLGLLEQKIGESICFLVLDEIDMLKGNLDEVLYDLTRINESLDYCRTTLIGISNNLNFREKLDPRVESSLGKEYIVFNSYDAKELGDILEERAKIAFFEGVLKEDVIPFCAALAAKEHGDARKALQLLRKVGTMAQRKQYKSITSKLVEEAHNELEKDYVIEYIKGMPLQAQLVLTSIYLIAKFAPDHIIITGDVYDVYAEIVVKVPVVRQLGEKRISDYIRELKLAGIIGYFIKSLGHHGRTKIISLKIGKGLTETILNEIEKLSHLLNCKPSLLQKNRVILKNNIFRKLL